MPVRFDSRPLVLRRAYTATMRATTVLPWRDHIGHGLHLFFVIAAGVISRNVANQQLLDAPPPAGPESLGKLYLGVALVAGVIVAAVGWFGRNFDARRVASVLHLSAAGLMAGAFAAPSTPHAVIVKYIVMELIAAVLLLAFGIMLGARMGPREARRVAARVGAGGILGGLAGGGALSIGATLFGSRELFLLAAALSVAPVFWLPSTRRRPGSLGEPARDRSEVKELSSYGQAVAVTTVLMVATTTLVDYVYRFYAKKTMSDDELTAFFGLVIILAGVTSIVFQLTSLDRLLDKLGLFSTAAIMPGALMACSAAFGLWPGVYSLMVLKLVDSGANMSVQQATGGLLLAPLGVRARAVWQGRIDGLARRGGQAMTGAFLAAFAWPPLRVVPLALGLGALWMLALLLTRQRYIKLLTAMLNRPLAAMPEVQAYDGATLRLLLEQLLTASPARAAVILDLLEQAEYRAPEPVLRRLAEADPSGRGAILVIEHLMAFEETESLTEFTEHSLPKVAGEALLALDEVDPEAADRAAKKLLLRTGVSEELRALAAGLLSTHDASARALIQTLAKSPQMTSRLAVAQALGRLEPGSPAEVGATLCALARDPDPEIARTALRSVGKHLSREACAVALQGLSDRRTRGAAMRALADLGPPVVAPIGEALGQARDPSAASALCWTLGQIGVAAGLEPLLRALASEHTSVRLSAAVALGAMARRQPNLVLPAERIDACYLPEIRWYGALRSATLSAWPKTPAGEVLRHSVRQRAQASLETLFRLFSLRHPGDAMQSIYKAINARDRAERQLALELLDTLLDSETRRALAEAIGEGTRRPKMRSPQLVLKQLIEARDPFVAELARVVSDELDGTPQRRASVLTAREGMRRSVVDQILELQSVVLFNQASAEDLGEVAALVVEHEVPANTILYTEGDPGDAMYLIRAGQVLLTRAGKPVDRVGPGDAFGIIAVLDRLPRELSATTQGHCSLLMLKAGDLHQLLADRPLLMHSIFRALTSSLRSQLERVAIGKHTAAEPDDIA